MENLNICAQRKLSFFRSKNVHQNRLVAWLCPNLMEDNALPQSRLQTPGLRGRGKERDVKKREVERERHGMG